MIFLRFQILCLSIILIAHFSCTPEESCVCENYWEYDKAYFDGDLVLHKDTCWVAIAGCTGCKPGPWLENNNDQWIPCEE